MDKSFEEITEFVLHEIPKVAERTDRNNEIPMEFLERMKENGLFNLKRFGLRGIFDVVRMAAKSSPAIANLLMSNLVFISHQKLREEQYENHIFSLSITEPGGGTDIKSNLLTTATDKENGKVIVNGEKMFSSMAQYASHYIVLANGSQGPTLYLVKKQEGVEVTPMDIISFRGTGLGAIKYREVEGEPLGIPGKGMRDVLHAINLGRIGYGIMALGITWGALDHVSGVAGKKIFGGKLSDFQSVKWMVAEIEIKRRQLEALIDVALERIEKQGSPDPIDVSIIKASSGELAQRATWIATQLSGGRGLTTAGTIDRLTRDARVLDIGEGSKEVLLDFIGDSTIKKYQGEATKPGST